MTSDDLQYSDSAIVHSSPSASQLRPTCCTMIILIHNMEMVGCASITGRSRLFLSHIKGMLFEEAGSRFGFSAL